MAWRLSDSQTPSLSRPAQPISMMAMIPPLSSTACPFHSSTCAPLGLFCPQYNEDHAHACHLHYITVFPSFCIYHVNAAIPLPLLVHRNKMSTCLTQSKVTKEQFRDSVLISLWVTAIGYNQYSQKWHWWLCPDWQKNLKWIGNNYYLQMTVRTTQVFPGFWWLVMGWLLWGGKVNAQLKRFYTLSFHFHVLIFLGLCVVVAHSC